MVLVIILIWLITLITLFIGAAITLYFKAPQVLKEAIGKVRHPRKVSIGVVDRPSAEKVNKMGSIEESGEEEFATILRKVGIKENAK